MTIKLDALKSWHLVPAGEALLLPGETESERRIRIDVNVEDRTWIYVSGVGLDVDWQFVAAVGPGLETVEFFAGGELSVKFAPAGPDDKDSQVWVYTAELEPNVSANPDAVPFTEIHQRRARNPELEMMQLIARQNERRMDEYMARMEAMMGAKSDGNEGTVDGAAGDAGEAADGGPGAPSGEDPAGDGGTSGDVGDGNDPAK